jgi:UDP-3-O-[3-hydroxymyristoyl] glucosamine N-acyltransferase
MRPLSQKEIKEKFPGATINSGAFIGSDATVKSGATVQSGATIGSGAVIQSGAIIGNNATVKSGAIIQPGAIIQSGAFLKSGAFIQSGAIIGNNATIQSGTTIGSGAIIQSGAFIGSSAVIGKDRTGVKNAAAITGMNEWGLTVHDSDDGIIFVCGCWNNYEGGTAKELMKAVKEKHGDNEQAKKYFSAIRCLKAVAKTWKE